MRTEVHIRKRKSGKWVVLDKPHPKAMTHWAEWMPLTVGCHRDIELANPDNDATVREVETWRYLLKDSSLLKGVEVKREDNKLTSLSMASVMQFYPAVAPKLLVAPVLRESTVTMAEHDIIQRECMTLWLGSGSTVEKPNPFLERAIVGMTIYEKYGIPSYSNIRDIPYKEFVVYRLAAQNYGEIMKLNSQGHKNQAEAVRQVRGG